MEAVPRKMMKRRVLPKKFLAQKVFFLWISVVGALAFASCRPSETDTADQSETGAGATGSDAYEVVVPGSHFHGVHGLTVSDDGRLFAASVVGQAIYEIDPSSGEVSVYIGLPEGQADDLEFGPGGQLVWTSILSAKVRSRTGEDGEIKVLAEGYPGANATAFNEEGRLFFSQVFQGDALWEIDPLGVAPPRQILDAPGGLNGFDFGPDGLLYGPLWFKGQVVKVDVDSGALQVVADGFAIPAAANFDSKGNLYVLDTQLGQVVRVDIESGEKKVVAEVPPSLDNLAFSPDDRLFVSNMADNAVYEIDPQSGEARTLVEGRLSMPGAMALWQDEGGETLYVADTFAYRTVNAETGEVTTVRRMHAQSQEELEYPFGASATEEHVLLTSWFAGTVQKIDRKTQDSLVMMHGFAGPVSAVELEDGRIVVAEVSSASLVVVSGEHGEDRTTVSSDLQGPVQLLDAGGGKVLLTESGSGTLSEIDLETGERLIIAEGLDQPEGFDRRPDGRVVIAEVGARRLVEVDPASGERRVLAEDLPIGLPAAEGAPPAYIATGVVVSSSGAVYFSSDLDNAIYRVRF